MNLYLLKTCIDLYKRRFDELEEDTLKPFSLSRTSSSRIAGIQGILSEDFPADFVRIITTYDFSHFSIGDIVFGYGDEYERLATYNLRSGLPWWGDGTRPKSLMMVADTTGWTILLNTSDGSMHAFDNPWNGVAEAIAPSFDLFLRAACTASLQEEMTDEFERDFLYAIGYPVSKFWIQVLKGWA